MEKKKAKKPRKSRIPRTRNAGTMTESMFWAMIRAALREKSRWWKPVSIARVKSRRPYKGPLKKQKWEYQCQKCKKWFPIQKTNVDHIEPVGSLNSSSDLAGFIERLFVEDDKLQLLCNDCHDIKTKKEKK